MVELANRPPRMASSDFRLDLSGFVSNVWSAQLKESQTFEHCLEPAFWMDVVTKVLGDDKTNTRGLLDKVVARKADTMQVADFIIVGIGPGRMRLVEERRFVGAAVPELKADSPLKTRWNPGKKGHEVVRQDGESSVSVMAGPFQDKGAAVAWINDHMTKMAA